MDRWYYERKSLEELKETLEKTNRKYYAQRYEIIETLIAEKEAQQKKVATPPQEESAFKRQEESAFKKQGLEKVEAPAPLVSNPPLSPKIPEPQPEPESPPAFKEPDRPAKNIPKAPPLEASHTQQVRPESSPSPVQDPFLAAYNESAKKTLNTTQAQRSNAQMIMQANASTALPPQSQAVQFDKAERVDRLLAQFIDYFIISILIIGSMSFFVANWEAEVTDAELIGSVAGSFLGYWILNFKLYFFDGQTIGKKIKNIKIVDPEGKTPGFQVLIFRSFLYSFSGVIPILGSIFSMVNILFIFKEDQRCLHDHLCRTNVVKA